MADEDIKPALTPEEWLRFPNAHHSLTKQRLNELAQLGSPLYFPASHGIAAINLFGQPFGFTHDDADLVLSLARGLEMDDRAEVRLVVAKIRALLPPEASNG